jgi:hypothetical protein
VLEKFKEACIDESAYDLMKEIKMINIARKHRPFQPSTDAHKNFLAVQLKKAHAIQETHPYIDLSEEIRFFAQS